MIYWLLACRSHSFYECGYAYVSRFGWCECFSRALIAPRASFTLKKKLNIFYMASHKARIIYKTLHNLLHRRGWKRLISKHLARPVLSIFAKATSIPAIALHWIPTQASSLTYLSAYLHRQSFRMNGRRSRSHSQSSSSSSRSWSLIDNPEREVIFYRS